jgi:site-specific DNA recombinase
MHQFKIALYIRCSTEEQGSLANPEGTIKNQEQRLRLEFDMKNRNQTYGSLVGIFIDDGISAKDTKRPAFQKMMRAIELGEVNMVMVTEYSRLSRNMRDFAGMWELFKTYKCSLISLRENFDTSSAAGEMMLYNMANLAQYERRMTSERVSLSRIDRAQRGLFNGGVIALGYKSSINAGYLEIDEEEAKVIKLVFEMFLKIGSQLKTAKWLNANNISTPRLIKGSGHVRVGHFTVGNVRCFLTNKVYMGVLEYKQLGKSFEAKATWPAIIEREDFLKVQTMLKANHRKKKPHQKSRYPYTLSGITFCKLCGEVMCGKSAYGRNGKVGYYEHSWSMRKDAALVEKAFSCGMHKRVPARVIEPLVHEQVEKLLISAEMATEILHSAKKLNQKNDSKDKKEKSLKKDYSSYSAQLEALTVRLAKLPVDIPADEIYKTMKVLGEKREVVKNELEALALNSDIGQEVPVELKDYGQFLKAMALLWFNPLSTSEFKEKIIKKLVARIEIDTNSVEVQFFAGKSYFRRESKGIDSRLISQTSEIRENLKNVGSSTCQNGAQDWTRTSILFTVLPPQGSASTNFATWALMKSN